MNQPKVENSGRSRVRTTDTAAAATNLEAGHENSKPNKINVPSKSIEQSTKETTRGADHALGACAGQSTPRAGTCAVREWWITPDRDGAIMTTRVISSRGHKIKSQTSHGHCSARAHTTTTSSSPEILMSCDPDFGIEIGIDLTELAKSLPVSWNTDEDDAINDNFRYDHSADGARLREFPDSHKSHPTPPVPALSLDSVDKQPKLKAWEIVPKLPLHSPCRAMVSHVVTPHHFYVVLKADLLKRHKINGDLFRKVTFGMPRFDRSRHTVPLVVVRHENIWKRGMLLHFDQPVQYDETNSICEVFLIDYGDTILVEENDLKKPGDEMMVIEPMAYRCSMANIVPAELKLSTEYLDGQNWHSSVSARLRLFGLSSKESVERGVDDISVECYEVNGSISSVDVKIASVKGTWAEHLVKVGLAERQNQNHCANLDDK